MAPKILIKFCVFKVPYICEYLIKRTIKMLNLLKIRFMYVK